VKCVKSKVGELCGLDMDIYYHKGTHGSFETEGKPNNVAASLLTFDPRIGAPEYSITGKAYVIVNKGKYELSRRQVWGIQEIASDAIAAYQGGIEEQCRGLRDIVRWSKQYREQKWGPPIAYKERKPKSRDWNEDIETDWTDPWEVRGWDWKGGSTDSSLLSTVACQHCHHEECTCRRCQRDNKQPCLHCKSRSQQLLLSFAEENSIVGAHSMPSVRSISFDESRVEDDLHEKYFGDGIILNDAFRVIDFLPQLFFSCG
jgi:hypothetical protein